MTDYTKSTNFTAKDSLSKGDPDKVVKGSEIDTEFNNIQTANNSKLNASRFPNVDANVTASDEELNKLDGVTASTSEINKLDGVTASTAQLNKTGDGSFLETPGAASDQTSLGLDSWRKPNANRLVLVLVAATARCDNNSEGVIKFEIDNSGAVPGTADVSETFVGVATINAPSGAVDTSVTGSTMFIVPAGGSYRIFNSNDPLGANFLDSIYESTL